MKRLNSFSAAIGGALTAVILTVIETVKGGILPVAKGLWGANTPEFWIFATALAFFGLLPPLMVWLVEGLVARSRWLRRRIIGTTFLEGTWVNRVTSRIGDQSKESSFGVLEIFFQDGDLRVSGTTFNETGSMVAKFASTFCVVEEFKLSFGYEKGPWNSDADLTEGYSYYRFQPKHPVPNTFTGFYVTADGTIVSKVWGQKVDDKLNLSNEEKHAKLVEAFGPVIGRPAAAPAPAGSAHPAGG